MQVLSRLMPIVIGQLKSGHQRTRAKVGLQQPGVLRKSTLQARLHAHFQAAALRLQVQRPRTPAPAGAGAALAR